MRKLWLDVESIGLNGPLMRIQYAVDNGPIKFLDYPFNDQAENNKLYNLLALNDTLLVAYNAVFDTGFLYKWAHEYIHGLPLDSPERPVQPFACRVLDLQVPAMLHGPFAQFAFSKGKSRSVARVRRIPAKAAGVVEERVLKAIRAHVPKEFGINVGHHQVAGKPELVTLSFSVDGRASLKAHARFYGAPTLSLPDLWPLPPREIEKPWLPYYNMTDYQETFDAALPILRNTNNAMSCYCRLDLLFLQLLWEKLGRPEPDHHSDCVAAVAYTRYHGFKVNRDVLQRSEAYYAGRVIAAEQALTGIDLKSAPQRLAALRALDPLVGSSRRAVLEELAKSERPSAALATHMLDFGKYRQRLLQVQKVLECRTGRAHPSLRVMGTATGRMAGEAGLNWQGIAQAESGLGLRAALEVDCGGDFDALEVTIAAAAYGDAQLQADLDAGVDLHSMTGSLIPAIKKAGVTYEQIRTGHRAKDKKYTEIRFTGKRCVFALTYGAEKHKLSEILSCGEPEAEQFQRNFFGRYAGMGRFRADAQKRFCTADTEGWQRASVGRMERKVVDLLGFERRFDFEAQVAEALWGLGSGGFRTGLHGSVVRQKEKGSQSIDNAVRSALLGGALAIQAAVMRQACNSPVQSTGAGLTKTLMARIWNRYRCPVLNIHDELCMGDADAATVQAEVVEPFLAEFRALVPSLSIHMANMNVWSDK